MKTGSAVACGIGALLLTARVLAQLPSLTPVAPVNAVTPQESTGAVLHHSLSVELDPLAQRIRVEDRITLPTGAAVPVEFQLNENLTLTRSSLPVQVQGAGTVQPAVGLNVAGVSIAPTQRYVLSATPTAGETLVINYEGRIHQQAVQNSVEYARSFAETTGIISEDGVYLNGTSFWIPTFGDQLMTFDMEVSFAEGVSGWRSVSQGERQSVNGWRETAPMEEVYLIAARFTEYGIRDGDVDMLAYLRTPDRNLANKYLDATQRYLALYEPLLGDYPFSKFALVENFWETGYGMPSFTLLGEQIIRFPFIIDSSYPHEILHNWWGNGVYPDYATGNWSEGLTAYLADHLFQEMNAAGHDYRKDQLVRYRNYVADGSDFPLSRFTSRNSAASQAVGYGKTLMVWHMLRQELGDALFLEGLKRFYEDFRFKRAGFADISRVFGELSGRDLEPFFEQWVQRTGAPEVQVSVEELPGNQARIMFAQVQPGDPYVMNMPIALVYAGEDEPRIYNVPLSQKVEGVMAENYRGLQAVLVDPYFDVFRKLHRAEIPPTIGQLFGASAVTFVLPRENRAQWAQMAAAFGSGLDSQVVNAEDIEVLPADRSVWILGRDNPFTEVITAQIGEYGVDFTATGITVAGSEVAFDNRASVLTASHPADPELAIGWIHVDDMVAMPGMIEKLPHYGRYSYLSFVGAEPTNDVKGNWTSQASPMVWVNPQFVGAFTPPALPAVDPLASLPPKYLPESLERHVTHLADPALQGRGLGSPGLDEAAYYLAEQFRAAGLRTLGGTYIHEWVKDIEGQGQVRMRNVIGVLPGSNPRLNARPAVVAAHYDHLGVDATTREVYPGADDNASGVAVMLEVAARLSRAYTPQRSIIFVAFTGEETGLLGSAHFVAHPPAPYRSEDFFAMVNLDSVGRRAGRPLQVFGAESAYEWPFMAQGIGFTIGVPSTLAAQGIAGSDHVSFLNAGVPAIHVFGGTHDDYHRTSDTIDKLDLTGLSEVALWIEEALVFLGDREAPLRVNLAGAAPIAVSENAGTARQASLGTVPDFAFAGPGVRVADVGTGGAADLAGLQAGDVLLRYNDAVLTSLQQYSDLLRGSAAGDVIRLEVQRGDQVLTVEATLQAR